MMLSRVLELLVVWQDWFSKRSVDDHLSCVLVTAGILQSFLIRFLLLGIL